MSLIRPFKGLRPLPEKAPDVVAPPYDVLNTDEARQRAAGRPWSFLHISKPEIDLPADTDPHADIVYQTGAANLERMIEAGILVRDPQESYYVYRLIMGEHVQTGLVAVASVGAYDTGRIKKHEFTRPDKEADRVRQIDALNAQTGPVFLTYRHQAEAEELISAATAGSPDFDLVADDGVRHILWPVGDREQVAAITAAFERMPALYIADGHHRSAAASRVAAMRNADGPEAPEAAHNYFLAVIFSDRQMRILDYNRVVRDLNGLSPAGFLERLQPAFTLSRADAPVRPEAPGVFGMYLDGSWYRLVIADSLRRSADPVRRLDVSLLADNLIEPVLGISDPRRDQRIDFVGGIRGLRELEKRVDSGEMQVAFSLYPTSLEDLMAVADNGQVMPPKSTWFEPKLADGLVSHVLD